MSGRGAIGSALALGARGCEFESRRPDHSLAQQINGRPFFFNDYFSFRTFCAKLTKLTLDLTDINKILF